MLTGLDGVCQCVLQCGGESQCWVVEFSSSSLPPTHLFHTHTSLQLVANQYLSSFLLLLPASVCMCCHGDHWCSPHTLCLCSSSTRMKPICGCWCRQAADVITSLGKKAYFYQQAQSIPSCQTYLWKLFRTLPARKYLLPCTSMSIHFTKIYCSLQGILILFWYLWVFICYIPYPNGDFTHHSFTK